MNKGSKGNILALGVTVALAIAAGGIATSMWKDYQTTTRIEKYNEKKSARIKAAEMQAARMAAQREKRAQQIGECRQAETFYTIDLVQLPVLEKVLNLRAGDPVQSEWLIGEISDIKNRFGFYDRLVNESCAGLHPDDHIVSSKVLEKVMSKQGDLSGYPFDFSAEPDSVSISRAMKVNKDTFIANLDTPLPEKSVCERSYYAQAADLALGAAYSDYLLNITSEDVDKIGIKRIKLAATEVQNLYRTMSDTVSLCTIDDTAVARVLHVMMATGGTAAREVEATVAAIERSPKFAALPN